MVGVRGGLEVRVGTRVVVSGSGDNQSTTYYTYAEAGYGRSLDMGLGVSPTDSLMKVWSSLVGDNDLQIGDPELDPAYTIRAAEPELARRLLTTPYVAEALRHLAPARFAPSLDDACARGERRGKTFDPGVLGAVIDQTLDLAHRVRSAREIIGLSSAEHVVQTAWRSVAEARGLQLDVAQTRMSGRYEGMFVEVDASLRGDKRWTSFVVRFDRPLGVGLRLTKQGALSSFGRMLGVQDIVVGDEVFDARFVVKGAPEAAVRAALTPEVRGRLVELQSQATTLQVEDDRLQAEVGWLVADAASVESALAAVAAAGAALARVSNPEAGPYRR